MANTNDSNQPDSIDGRIERAKDRALGAHDSHPSHADELGEATGGISGVLVGAGIGSAAGPIGTLIGGIAGALGGWWTGRAISEAAGALTHADDEYFREHYEQQKARPADRSYEDARGAYYLGHIAAHNPNFARRSFADLEPELENGWSSFAEKFGRWETVKLYASEGFSRGRSKLDDSARAAQEARTEGERSDSRR